MSHISLIRLTNFRNLYDQEIKFSKSANVFIGKNGGGKTNLLESISLLSPGRGLKKEILTKITKFKIKNPWVVFLKYDQEDKTTFDIATTYDISKSESVIKKILINGIKQKKSLELDSLPNLIWFIPEMERLFGGPPSLRRNFIDRIVYSFDKKILFELNSYSKLIRERYQIIQMDNIDENWLDKVEESIVILGISIIRKRDKILRILNETFKIDLIPMKISGCQIKMTGYIDELFSNNNQNIKEKYLDEIRKSRINDRFRGGCGIGPHKSDLEILYLKNNIYANYCSTGQQKEIILNMLLCQSYCLIKAHKKKPILIFDEVCSHLDENTRSIILYLIEWLKVQVFMTGNDEKLFSFLSKKAKFFSVKSGSINSL